MIDIIKTSNTIHHIDKQQFDSHEFIKMYIKLYEKDYVEMLIEKYNDSDSDEIFRRVHAQIGAYISSNQKQLGVEWSGDVSSENIKGDITPNAQWRKL